MNIIDEKRPLKVMVLDDDPMFLAYTKKLISHIDQWECTFLMSDPEDALRNLKNRRIQIDVLVLDVDMPGVDGFTFMREIQDLLVLSPSNLKPISVVMCSGNDYETERVFAYPPDAFLKKPITLEKLNHAVQRIERRIKHMPKLIKKDRFIVRIGRVSYIVKINEIVYIEVQNMHTTIYLVGGKQLCVRKPLNHFLNLLPSDQFVQIHESRVIALAYWCKEDDKHVYLQGYEDRPLKLGRRDIFVDYEHWKEENELKSLRQ